MFPTILRKMLVSDTLTRMEGCGVKLDIDHTTDLPVYKQERAIYALRSQI